jgi:hypothetical protein
VKQRESMDRLEAPGGYLGFGRRTSSLLLEYKGVEDKEGVCRVRAVGSHI